MEDRRYAIPLIDPITCERVVVEVDKATFDKFMAKSSRMDLLRQLKSTVEQLIALEGSE